MKYYIGFDGGGSKLQSVLYNENFDLISSAKSGAMNTSSTSPEATKENARKCCEELLRDTGVTEIETVFGVFSTIVKEALSECIKVNKFDDRGGEGAIGIYAAFVKNDAVITLSGTGSVVFYTSSDGHGAEAGGYGSVIYDEGSGYYLGRRAFAAAIEYAEERGPKTLLTDLITEKLEAEDFFDATSRVYSGFKGMAPIPTVAYVATCVGEAARRGDRIAEELLYDVGRSLSSQTIGLIKKFKVPDNAPIVITGGHFKNDIRILRAFESEVHKVLPEREIIVPYFEPIVGAAMALRYHDGGDFTEEEILHIKDEFSVFRYKIVGE